MQCGVKQHPRTICVLDLHRDLEVVACKLHRQFHGEAVRPQAARLVAIPRTKDDSCAPVAYISFDELPNTSSQDAVMRQRSIGRELGKDNRHASPNRRPCGELALFTQVQTFPASSGNPGNDVCAVVCHDRAAAVRRTYLYRRQSMKVDCRQPGHMSTSARYVIQSSPPAL